MAKEVQASTESGLAPRLQQSRCHLEKVARLRSRLRQKGVFQGETGPRTPAKPKSILKNRRVLQKQLEYFRLLQPASRSNNIRDGGTES